jgi:beta-carotene ketolase (CrtO type)
VRSIVVEGGRAIGAELADGQVLRADQVIAAVDPATLFGTLLDPGLLSLQTRDELRAMSICESNITYFTGHAALAGRPRLHRHGRGQELLQAGYQMIVPSYASLRAALEAAEHGRVPDDIPIWSSFPSIADRSLVPPGSDAETLYVMTPVTPYDLAEEPGWDGYKQRYLDRVLDTVEEYVGGVRGSLIGTAAVSPADMARWTTKGHACHIDMTLSQMGPWRPTPSLSGYRTPVAGLWQVSAGAHPLPSVNGWGGRTAARTFLRAQRSAPGHTGPWRAAGGAPTPLRERPGRSEDLDLVLSADRPERVG